VGELLAIGFSFGLKKNC